MCSPQSVACSKQGHDKMTLQQCLHHPCFIDLIMLSAMTLSCLRHGMLFAFVPRTTCEIYIPVWEDEAIYLSKPRCRGQCRAVHKAIKVVHQRLQLSLSQSHSLHRRQSAVATCTILSIWWMKREQEELKVPVAASLVMAGLWVGEPSPGARRWGARWCPGRAAGSETRSRRCAGLRPSTPARLAPARGKRCALVSPAPSRHHTCCAYQRASPPLGVELAHHQKIHRQQLGTQTVPAPRSAAWVFRE